MTIDRDQLVEAAEQALAANALAWPRVSNNYQAQARAVLDAILPTVQAQTVHEVAEAIRHHATAPSELVYPIVQIDSLILWVADWAENPPEWVEVSYRKGATE